MHLKVFCTYVALALLLVSCKPALTKQALYGQWKYIKVENPNSHPPDSVRSAELEIERPYIQFTKSDSLIIMWGGKVLSHGTFRIEGNNIRFKEMLANGGIRDFPFWVSKITGKELVFETTGEDGSRVTAVKE